MNRLENKYVNDIDTKVISFIDHAKKCIKDTRRNWWKQLISSRKILKEFEKIRKSKQSEWQSSGQKSFKT